jgi:lipoate---protein ligase
LERAVTTPAKTVWRLIPLWRGSGRRQMAIDRWLFEQCCVGLHPPVLRFYEWAPAAISLGRHQRYWPQHWQSLQWEGQTLDLVRRPTGGRAVLHEGDLTYSLVVPDRSGHRRETYEYLCQFLIEGWRSLGTTLQFGQAGRGYQRQVDCFASATAADLVDSDGEKLIGSAQAWRGQTVLQHGSMQLQRNLALQRQVFDAGEKNREKNQTSNSLVRQPTFPSVAAIVDALTQAAAQQFDATFEVKPLTPDEWSLIDESLKASDLDRLGFDPAAPLRR